MLYMDNIKNYYIMPNESEKKSLLINELKLGDVSFESSDSKR